MVQWLRLCASNARGAVSIPGQGTKVPHALRSKKKKKKDQKKCLNKKQTITSVGRDVEKVKPSYIAGRNAKRCSHCGKQFGGSSKS